ncbi:MAG: Ig-like domain-containing protein [Blautia faecis]
MKLEKSYTLNASILPVDTTADKTLVWTGSNPMIAAISNAGTITALKEGNAIISVSAEINPQIVRL